MANWQRLPESVLKWTRVATHVHTAGNSACSGQQTVAEVIQTARELGFETVVLNEHTGNPGAPTRLPANAPEIKALTAHGQHVARAAAATGYDLRFGLEANTVPRRHGSVMRYELDWDSHYAGLSRSRLNIGSLHGDAGQYKQPAELWNAIAALCHSPRVDVLGHITRYVSNVEFDWSKVGQLAAITGTVVELNLNLMFKELGQNKPKPDESFDSQFHRSFLKAIASTDALVSIGLDVHNAGMWPGAEVREGWETSLERVQFILGLIEEAGFTPERVVNSTRKGFDYVLSQPKHKRF